jgi:hypothetical protein
MKTLYSQNLSVQYAKLMRLNTYVTMLPVARVMPSCYQNVPIFTVAFRDVFSNKATHTYSENHPPLRGSIKPTSTLSDVIMNFLLIFESTKHFLPMLS